MRGFPLERPAAPAWILLVPLAAIGVAWAMSEKKKRASTPRPKGPSKRWVTPRRAARFEPHFKAATAKYGLPAGLLSRIASRESGYNPNAVSPAGAVGLMQILPRAHPGVNAKDPLASIDYAAKYLRQLFEQFGAWTLAVAAYNAGPGNVRKYGGVPPFKETRAYVAAILPDIGVPQPEPGVRYA